jgi:LemA protein
MNVVLVGLVVVVAIAAIVVYNRLVRLRNRLRNAFAQIDVQLHRRHDLIPNLVEVARGYLSHERETLEAVIAARNASHEKLARAESDPTNAAAVQELGRTESALSGALGRLLAVSEAYPDLKANETMAQLSEELTTTENRIAFARQAYNDAVTGYNTARETFPSSLVSESFGFRAAALFEVEEDATAEAPRIAFDRP